MKLFNEDHEGNTKSFATFVPFAVKCLKCDSCELTILEANSLSGHWIFGRI